MGRRSETQFSGDAKAQASEFAVPSRSLTVKAIVLAAVLALIGAIALVGALDRDANAFTPYDATNNGTQDGNGNGGKPTITPTMTGPTSYPGDGQAFKYEGSVNFAGVEPGAGGTYTVTVNADPNAPFVGSALTNSDFKNSVTNGSVVEGPTLSDDKLQITFKVKPNSSTSDMTVDFAARGRLKSGLPDATIVFGSINGSFKPTLKASLEPWADGPYGSEGKVLTPPAASCVGTAKFAYTVPDGGYLMDIKFADARGDRSVEYIGEPTFSFSNDGADTTSTVKANMTVVQPDPTAPFFGKSEPLIQAHPNARWIDSYNWKYDPKYSTGDTWLPAGSHFTIERDVRFTNCVNGVATNGNFDLSDTILVNAEIGKNAVPVEESAVISFATPGEYTPPAACNNLWFVQAGNNRGNQFGYWEGLPDAPKSVLTPGRSLHPNGRLLQTESLAISNATTWLDGKLWFQSNRRNKLYDSNALSYIEISNPTNVVEYDTQGLPRNTFNSSAFDKDGNIYVFGNDGRLYQLNLAQRSTQWVPLFKLQGQGNINDFVFDDEGNLTGVSRVTDSSPYTMFRVPAAKVKSSGEYRPPTVSITGTSGDSLLWGLGYGPSGVLYASGSSGTLFKLNDSRLNSDGTGTSSVSASKIGEGDGGADLASCNFGKPQGSEGGFKSQKSAIDPVTGQVAAPGESTTGKLKIKNGFVKARYVVSVANLGEEAATPKSNIRDTFKVPAGLDVESVKINGTRAEVTGNGKTRRFAIPKEQIDGNAVKNYNIAINFRVVNLGNVSVNEAECTRDNNGFTNGFFNNSELAGDTTEGDDSGCVPFEIPKRARLRLVKKIVNADGSDADQADADAFYLSAGTPKNGDSVVGFSGPGGEVPATGYETVAAGTYQLSEAIVDGKKDVAAKYRQHGNWKCKKANGEVVQTADTVTVANGDAITCVVSNKPSQVYIQKKPFDTSPKDEVSGGQGNPHWGGYKIVENADGSFTAKYSIRVYSSAPRNLPVDSGPIFEQFSVPEGLVWDGEKKATVVGLNRFVNADTKVTPPGGGKPVNVLPKKEYSKQQFEAGVKIADNVSNLLNTNAPNEANVEYHYRFTVEIPLKLDLRANADRTGTNFSDHYDDLKTCEKGDENGKFGSIVGLNKGIVNNASMVDEDKDSVSNGNWEKDNHACIPIRVKQKWSVNKSAKSDAGTFAEPGTAGSAVKASENGTKVSARFKVTVKNEGRLAGMHPEIRDSITLNGGYTVASVSVTKGGQKIDVDPINLNGKSATFTIPAGSDLVLPKGSSGGADSVDYIVTVEGSRDTPPSTEDYAAVGTCEDSDGSLIPSRGLFNKVDIDEDADGSSENNKACVPVKTVDKPITIQKFDNGMNTLEGAEFVVFEDNDGTPNNAASKAVTKDETVSTGHVFKSVPLALGKTYWLKETKAPAGGHELLPQPLKFIVTADGITIFDAANGSEAVASSEGIASADGGVFQVRDDAKFTIDVHDPRAMELPLSGGIGRWPIVALGVLVVVISMLYMMKTSGVSRRRD